MIQIQEKFALSTIARFGIGGLADFFVCVKTAEELQEALAWAQEKNIKWTVIGEGSNLLISDKGFAGIAIQVGLSEISFNESEFTVTAGAGVNLQKLIEILADKGWGGMENMYGIPGSIGAAIYGDVGAYGTEIRQVVTKVLVLKNNAISEMSAAECEFDYRTSIFKQHKDWLILSATLMLQPADAREIKKHMNEIMSKRLEKYPAGLKCPGSYFKNIVIPELSVEQQEKIQPYMNKAQGIKIASGVLLEAVGAKGMKVGGAEVASYHANLIFNSGHATAQDVLILAQKLKNLVWEKFGIQLEEEVQFLGEID